MFRKQMGTGREAPGRQKYLLGGQAEAAVLRQPQFIQQESVGSQGNTWSVLQGLFL